MDDGLTLEYLVKIEHTNHIREPRLSRRAQLERELTLMAGADGRTGSGVLPRISLALGRIGGLFAMPRTTAGQA